VVYIIAGREKAAFERLVTDAEREHFIEQFWRRRDPNPATPENEFKEEHYRRIAYANERFPSSSVAGWQTDRGRIYILHGPPDEIESHPGIRELWMYRHFDRLDKDLLVTFVDPDNSGELRLAGEPELLDPVKQ
jgi:GWxTD domain-containing protein